LTPAPFAPLQVASLASRHGHTNVRAAFFLWRARVQDRSHSIHSRHGGQPHSMKRISLGVCVALLSIGAYAQWTNPSDDVPAYHADAPVAGADLPPILTPAQLKQANLNLPWQAKAYQDAAHIPRVLYQLPCNCRCDKALGHTSLHSCFSGTHGAVCSTCAQEGVYAYRMTKAGKTPAQIRAGIAHREYESIDLNTLS
jgi:hypothetical protein